MTPSSSSTTVGAGVARLAAAGGLELLTRVDRFLPGVVDRGRADVGHDTVENHVVEVAVVGDAGEAPIVQETLEASIERPLHIHRAGVVRVQELPGKAIDIWLRQQT
jgi:hypothetical protein